MTVKNKVPLFDTADTASNAWLAAWAPQDGVSGGMVKIPIPRYVIARMLGASIAAVTGAATLTKASVYVPVNTNAGAFAIALPSGPDDGHEITIKDENGHCGTNALTITGTVDGVTNPTIDTDYGWMRVRWNATTSKWCQV